MAKTKKPSKAHNDWFEAIAEHAQLSLKDTQEYLRQLQIRPAPQLPHPKKLRIQKLAFSGKKAGLLYKDDFAFEWNDLSPGLWCLASHKNFAGKSSVLEILLWALRGKPKSLQPDVRQWLKQVELTFRIDETAYAVRFNVNQGKPQGVLIQLTSDKEHELFAFDSEDSFENAMARFMLEALGLDQIPARRTYPGDTDKQTVWNSWLSFSNIFYIGVEHEHLLGDDGMNGMPGRLLQLFAGLPWASTKALALAAQGQVEQEERNRNRRAEEGRKANEAAVQELEQDLRAAQAELSGAVADEVDFLSQLDSCVQNAGRLSSDIVELQSAVAIAQAELHTAKQASVTDAQHALDMRETEIAEKVFNGLRPTCCPRCDQKIAAARIQQEEQSGKCSVCTTALVATDADYEPSLQEAKARALASQAAVNEVEDRLQTLKERLRSSRTALLDERNRLSTLEQKRSSFVRRRELELKVAKLEGAVQERRKSATTQETSANPLLAVAKAAVHETELRVDTLKTTFFEPLNEEIVAVGKTFGMEHLEKVQLDLAARLHVWKGGEKTTFSKLSPGERLRLRIATIVAMLRVAQKESIGRHPGLLIIESPGAQESSDTDVAALLKTLLELTKGLSHLQLFVATANAGLATQVLSANQCRVAPPDGHLW